MILIIFVASNLKFESWNLIASQIEILIYSKSRNNFENLKTEMKFEEKKDKKSISESQANLPLYNHIGKN